MPAGSLGLGSSCFCLVAGVAERQITSIEWPWRSAPILLLQFSKGEAKTQRRKLSDFQNMRGHLE